ncbi:MAG TPA: class I SAM-dependent DNA methyltransferase, partial [Candidatus Hydrogenedentes bacterium]|nr:class I SAM-dependent DNA methyltransferase [Candidatus Hydrogenedentota bacterium]
MFHFGVLTSTMHMSWMRHVAGRLESRYRYSGKLVYNNFPWPKDISPKQKAAVEAAAKDVLEVRKQYPNASLADLYDPHAMPGDLHKAHTKLDRAVDRCYRSQPFSNDVDRMAYLFALYEAYTAPLSKPSSRRAKRGE